ncbi:MAG: ParB N-terminal domain-containing protein [Methylocystis sp.]|uniref:ParB/RepB/Spo0J family partition protein n=1 Tax=Methylocystis sp. TaxID=1911079 RepID=UPI003DA6C307
MTLRLFEISGVSRFNARRDAPNQHEIEEMAASIFARGVTTPLIIRMEDGTWRALDGGRRLAALAFLASENKLPEGKNFLVPTTFFEGDDEAAAEVSLISFVHRRDLHPVEEFERFVELQERFGLDVQAIAARTGKTTGFVKGRMRLARLSPKVRAAWREGKLTAEQARAFSASESHEAQDALLEGNSIDLEDSARWIARELSGSDVSVKDKRAVFVGLDAYVAAGGRLDEQLFEDESFILDTPILDRLAREKLEREADQVAWEEGWGWAETSYGEANPVIAFRDMRRFDHTEEENARLDEIEGVLENGDLGDAEIATLEHEVVELQTRALLRAIGPEERAGLGVWVSISPEGELEITRAYGQKQAATPAEATEEEDDGMTPPGESRPSAAAPPPAQASEPIGKSTRAILDETATLALSDACTRNPRLAMLFAVASLGCGYGGSMVNLSGATRPGFSPENTLLAEIRHERFEKALAICARHEVEDPATLPVALATLIGGLVSAQRAPDFETVRIGLATASHFCAIAVDLRDHMDFEAFYKAEPRDVAIDAIRAMDGSGAAADAGKLKKTELAKRAAILARDRQWLPAVLADALGGESGEQVGSAPDTRSTAEAMREAIEADEAAEDAQAGDIDTSISAVTDKHGTPLLGQFLRERVHYGNEALDAGRLKASELYAAYAAYVGERAGKPLNLAGFGAALAELGVKKKRLKTGVHYLNISLRNGSCSDGNGWA